jgi:hypothetical protein
VTTFMSANLHNIELMELAARIRRGDVSPVAVTRAGAAFQRVTSWHRRHPDIGSQA